MLRSRAGYNRSQAYECVLCDGFVVDGVCGAEASMANCETFATFCISCLEGHALDNFVCAPVDGACRRSAAGGCVLCADNTTRTADGRCVHDPAASLAVNNYAVKCPPHSSPLDGSCAPCEQPDCVACLGGTTCLLCEGARNADGVCERAGSAAVNDHLLGCPEGALLAADGTCRPCSEHAPGSLRCDAARSLQCAAGDGGFVLVDGACRQAPHCRTTDGAACLACDDGFLLLNSTTCVAAASCTLYEGGECRRCAADTTPFQGACVDLPPGCLETNGERCVRCADGTFLNASGVCESCAASCATCAVTSRTCLSCSATQFLQNNACVDLSELDGKCAAVFQTFGCARCLRGFYRNERACEACAAECATCLDGASCSTCGAEWFMTVDGTCKRKNETRGCLGDVSSAEGCLACADGFYLNRRECHPCAVFGACARCAAGGCVACAADHVLAGGTCTPVSAVAHCTAAADSRCAACSFWHRPNAAGTACDAHAVWWLIVVAVLAALLVFSALTLLFVWAANRTIKRVQMARRTNVVDKKKVAVPLLDCGDGLLMSTKRLSLDKLDVGKPVAEVVYVCNISRATTKLQFVTNGKNDELVTVAVEPEVVVLRRNQAASVTLTFTPHYTCELQDVMKVLAQRRGRAALSKSVAYGLKTTLSTWIYYTHIAQEAKIGEGSFGVVFRGTYRGNAVAVKKYKSRVLTEDQTEEFLKEVEMLDKFRCDQIVHFYGACVVPDHVMLVTEFAPCGSLMDCIKARAAPPKRITAKVLLDAARGLAYLHANGILHRDIKPDNVLVFSLDDIITVNGKLTDFGSSRNINAMMTNMTFTKGIGTPVYMAPEILDRQKYKTPADMYSFGVTMYAAFRWGEVFSRTIFVFPWDIASFVLAGNRPQRVDGIDEDAYGVISDCWKHMQKQRLCLGLPALTRSCRAGRRAARAPPAGRGGSLRRVRRAVARGPPPVGCRLREAGPSGGRQLTVWIGARQSPCPERMYFYFAALIGPYFCRGAWKLQFELVSSILLVRKFPGRCFVRFEQAQW